MSFAKVGHAIGKAGLLREESYLSVRPLSTQLTICLAAKAIAIRFAGFNLIFFVRTAQTCPNVGYNTICQKNLVRKSNFFTIPLIPLPY